MNPALLSLLGMLGSGGLPNNGPFQCGLFQPDVFQNNCSTGVTVIFYRGVSKSPRESSGVSLPSHTLADAGGGTYTITENGTVSMDLTSSPNYEGYDY